MVKFNWKLWISTQIVKFNHNGEIQLWWWNCFQQPLSILDHFSLPFLIVLLWILRVPDWILFKLVFFAEIGRIQSQWSSWNAHELGKTNQTRSWYAFNCQSFDLYCPIMLWSQTMDFVEWTHRHVDQEKVSDFHGNLM